MIRYVLSCADPNHTDDQWQEMMELFQIWDIGPLPIIRQEQPNSFKKRYRGM